MKKVVIISSVAACIALVAGIIIAKEYMESANEVADKLAGKKWC